MNASTKTLLISLLLMSQISLAQQPTTAKLYLFNSSGRSFRNPFTLKTSLYPNQLIKVASQECAVLEVNADSLGLIVNNQTESIPLERGQTHYYVVSSYATSAFTVSEVSRSIFWLTAQLNDSQKLTQYHLGEAIKD